MKRFLILCLVLFALSAPILAQELTTTPYHVGSPRFSILAGTGHIWTGEGSYSTTVGKAEWQVAAGFRWNIAERYGIQLNVTRDGGEITRWLNEHEFTSEMDTTTYRYTVVDAAGVFVLNPGDKARILLYAGPSWYKSGDLSKVGYMGGVGVEYDLTRSAFVSVAVKYRHVEDFIVPVANVIETGISVGVRF